MDTDNLSDYAPLKSYLSKLATFEERDWELLNELLYIKQFDTKEYFHRAGRQCKTIGFILQGCFRWVKNLNGVERTFDFAIEHDFVTDYVSIMTQKPGEMDIIAVEKTTLICMDADRMLKLFDSSFSWQKAGRHLAEHTACYAMERLVASYYETPQIRYERLIQTSPELFLRIPHHILANYLGITKETLSRLRSTNK
ncbi:Crp/Fnr family transcriptional regulator [Chitinophaga varians]|uniref:Crp/Fnr family transcriptional regulator n=1 Tax=Chitinophaga varians TaxID=2202339 RepID=UPI00165F945F|nr:cyclic nucleotide-binding domain-containing protein [Chitinophaga varians]MBC9915033.1 Crp/Fnr family transcriptional regulator [Chitinophaga varians]